MRDKSILFYKIFTSKLKNKTNLSYNFSEIPTRTEGSQMGCHQCLSSEWPLISLALGVGGEGGLYTAKVDIEKKLTMVNLIQSLHR